MRITSNENSETKSMFNVNSYRLFAQGNGMILILTQYDF